MNELLDQWSRLYATLDTEIARYPFWRYVTELVEDLEPSNPGLWSNRVQPLLRLLQNPDYAPPRGIRIREPSFNHMPMPPYPPHWVATDEAYTTPSQASRSRSGTRRGSSYMSSGYCPRLPYTDTEPTTMDIINGEPKTKSASAPHTQQLITNTTSTPADPS